MADIKSPEDRSRNMRAIRSKDTKPEVYLRKLLFAQGLRYRKNVQKLPGCPDIYFARYQTAVFVHGCFWHRHPGCKYAYMPKSRAEFWQQKFDANTRRDESVHEELKTMGIRYLVVWECTLREMKKDQDKERSIIAFILSYLKGTESSSDPL